MPSSGSARGLVHWVVSTSRRRRALDKAVGATPLVWTLEGDLSLSQIWAWGGSHMGRL